MPRSPPRAAAHARRCCAAACRPAHARRRAAARLPRPATARGGACCARAARACRTPAQRTVRHALPCHGARLRVTRPGCATSAAHVLAGCACRSPCAAWQGRTCTSRVAVDTTLVLRSGAVSGALPSPRDHSLPAAPGRAPCRAFPALQLAQRGGALAATAGEAGEAEAVEGAFFNRQVELKSLATLLAGPPAAVLVMTGPPSCGKSGARVLLLCRFCVGLR